MLENYAENLILPAYLDFTEATGNLQSKVDVFCNEPNSENLLKAREAFIETALKWQFANSFNFGPAGESGLQKSLIEEIAAFPLNIDKTENYIKAGDYTFNNFDRDTRGLFAIDYLLFVHSTDSIISIFNQNNYKLYLKKCADEIKNKAVFVSNSWQSGYKQSFINNNGTDIGSSTSYFYNEFLKSFEALKNFKLAIPLGLRPGQTKPLPKNVEAFYSGISIKLAKAHWQALKYIWDGIGFKNNNPNGIGLKEYLESVEGGKELISSTVAQMAAVDNAFNQLNDNERLSDLILNDFNKVNAVHIELQKQTRFFKSDLSSLIGIAITYSSGDGD